VHHGNGVEEGFRPSPLLFYGSTHEKDNYPGTGKEPNRVGEAATNEDDRRIVNRYLSTGKKSKAEFRVKWQQVIDEMIRFGPNLVIISAGFDAHKDDPLGGCQLDEADFGWATQVVLDACVALNAADPVPCISLLEGGYNVKAIADSAVVHCRALRDWTLSCAENAAVLKKQQPQLETEAGKTEAEAGEETILVSETSDLHALHVHDIQLVDPLQQAPDPCPDISADMFDETGVGTETEGLAASLEDPAAAGEEDTFTAAEMVDILQAALADMTIALPDGDSDTANNNNINNSEKKEACGCVDGPDVAIAADTKDQEEDPNKDGDDHVVAITSVLIVDGTNSNTKISNNIS
jgi:hypothetical protein